MQCEQHINIKEKILDHEERIRGLERQSIRLVERMDGLCKEISSLTSWIKGLITLWLTSMGGFFIWYIQSLSR